MSDADTNRDTGTRRRPNWWAVAFCVGLLILGCLAGIAAERTLGSGGPLAGTASGQDALTFVQETEETGNADGKAADAEGTEDGDGEAEPTDGAEPQDEGEAVAAGPASEASAEPAAAEAHEISVMMIGDMLMHDECVQAGRLEDGSYDYDFIFEPIGSLIAEADLKILNQETVMGEPERGYWLYMGAAGPIMNTPTALADAEVKAGFNCVLKATNHTLDLGYSGLAHELDYWQAAHPEIPVLGVNNPNKVYTDDGSQDYVDNVYVFEADGIRVAILNYTWATNESVDWERDHVTVSFLSEEKIASDVEAARAQGADFIIACPHWGIEYQTEPSEEEYHYAQYLCNLGVDVIFGCHPHILQPMELLRNQEGHMCVCFYSVGNFEAASLMEAYSMIGGVARVTLGKGADGSCTVCSASLVPTVICHSSGHDMRPYPLAAWTQELCDRGRRPQLTPAWCADFCAGVLGDAFDRELGFAVLDVNAEGRLV